MNKYFEIKRLEFLVTFKCTSRCDHCFIYDEDDPVDRTITHMDLDLAKKCISDLCKLYDLNSMMTFGGEPLLFPDFTLALFEEAKRCGIKKRQIITNGYWTNNKEKIVEILTGIKKAEVNQLCFSIDCFHEKYLNYDIVEFVLKKAKELKLEGVKLNPAWVVGKDAKNPYNEQTKALLERFAYLGFNVGYGNIISPQGRAKTCLKEYFSSPSKRLTDRCGELDYREDPSKIRGISVCPNGDVMACGVLGNLYKNTIEEILENYDYEKELVLKTAHEQGAEGLYKLAEKLKIELKQDGHYQICELCQEIRKKYLNKK